MALVLARKHGESVHIGEEIVVTVRIEATRWGPSVRLVIDAPRSVKVVRSELVDHARP